LSDVTSAAEPSPLETAGNGSAASQVTTAVSQPTQPKPQPSPETDIMRIRYGAWLILAGFVLLAIVFGVAVSHYKAASDVAAVVGSVAAVIASMVGAFFGVQAASASRESAEAARSKAESLAQHALGGLEPDVADKILNKT
jgi:hypothetical protein